jgi:prepilin-type N-terminal cleavage/methylation domain-containing protein
MKKAFTLVELLIVITLISILSVAVLATINPIEQTNKARDAQFKNDAAEILSAYERYFASQNEYPWNSGAGATVAYGTAIAIDSTSPAFGVVGSAAIGDTDSNLFKTSELKASFLGKASFKATTQTLDMMYTYSNGSDNNYVCYVPKAKVNRTGANAAKLRCLNMVSNPPTIALVGVGTCGTIPTDALWSTTITPNANSANLMCVPE